ncbi:MAG: phosphatase PAP2 family protein [Lachnospiraceae bacterium]|nr:phosphatase PAP2 family protein [Lachnospiraceae bacterium]
MNPKREKLDFRILYWVQCCKRSSGRTHFWKFWTFLGDAGWFWMATVGFLLASHSLRAIGFIALKSLIISSLLTNLVLKPIFRRDRPFEAFPVLEPLVRRPKDRSFPSGHTSASFAVAIVLLALLPLPIGLAFVAIATLIGLSRIYLGVHFPSDVAVGAAVGTIVAICCI